MNFDLSLEQRELKAMCRDFAREVIAPHAEEWNRAHRFQVDVFRRLGELELCGSLVPEEYRDPASPPLRDRGAEARWVIPLARGEECTVHRLLARLGLRIGEVVRLELGTSTGDGGGGHSRKAPARRILRRDRLGDLIHECERAAA